MNMLDEVNKILTYYHGENNFDMNPFVPREIEHYARAVLDIPDEEYILAAMRTSFTKFHRGLVIGRDALYWRNDHKIGTTVNKLTWKELSERKSKFRPGRRTVELGEGAVFDNIGSMNKPSTVINLLDLLIDKYDLQLGSSEGFIFKEEHTTDLIRAIPNNKAEIKIETEASSADAATVSFFNFITNIFKKVIGK